MQSMGRAKPRQVSDLSHVPPWGCVKLTTCNAIQTWDETRSKGKGKHFFRVEDLVVALKETGDGGPVQLHFGGADTDRTVTDHSVLLDTDLADTDAFDA